MNTDTDGGEGIIAYRNKNTNEIHLSEGVHVGLEARENFERVSLDHVPPSALDAARRAAAERAARHEAGKIRSTGGFTDERNHTPIIPTEAHAMPQGVNPQHGILSRPGMRDVQIGSKPWEHPKGQEAIGAVAANERANPDRRGVLERGGDPGVTVHETLLPRAVTIDPDADRKAAEGDFSDSGNEGGNGGQAPTTPVTQTPATPDEPEQPATPDSASTSSTLASPYTPSSPSTSPSLSTSASPSSSPVTPTPDEIKPKPAAKKAAAAPKSA